uniref:CYP704A234 n=1 Tax=Plumbago zeylanica TaxID=76149 RepID=A0A9E9M3T7_9CARY|nr:CYP704A234 [Plumbago zeylanica]
MIMMELVLSAAGPAVAILSVLVSLALTIHFVKSIRDPRRPPVVGTILHFAVHFNRLYDYLTEVAEKKKHSTFRVVSPNHRECYTVDPRNVEHFIKTKFDKYVISDFNKDMVSDLFGQGIFAVDGHRWRRQRKLASFEFSTRVLRDFSSGVFRKNTVRLVAILSALSEKKTDFDVLDILKRFSLDSIFEIGFGVELNCLDGSNKQGIEFMKAFDEANALVFYRFVDPFWKIKKALNIGFEATLKRHLGLIHDFARQVIATKRNLLQNQDITLEKKQDILSRFLQVGSKQDIAEDMNDQHLRDIVLNFIIAGKDTTSNTLAWFIYMLCKNPLIQERLAQEVQQNMLGGEESESESETIHNYVNVCITDDALEKMQYLHAALTETLRLYPAVPIDGRCATEDDVLPDGYKVERGDNLCYVAYAMGRMRYIWGDDAEEFRPERWIDNNGVFKPESPFKFVAFHGGPRMCLGKDFAYRQMKIVSMAMLYFFRFKLADETKRVTYRTMFTLHIDGGLHVTASPRRMK